MTRPIANPPRSAAEYADGIRTGDRTTLARAITLIESNARRHRAIAEELVALLLPHAGRSIRVGITGVPGVGKSTFIETLGLRLCEAGHRLAVLAVDPSSSVSGGSILGDKTRMEHLARHPAAFIRPSPSGGSLGGVARKSRETIVAMEAWGCDIVLVETVGVGQSETAVRSMVDFFLVLMLAGAGDELQGIKKGIIELADALVVNKADGDNLARAEATRGELARVLHYLTPPDPDWRPKALACSAVENRGVTEVWELVERYRTEAGASGLLTRRRTRQTLDWMRDLLSQELLSSFHHNPRVRNLWAAVESDVLEGRLSPAAGVERLLAAYHPTDHDPKH